MRRTEQQEQGGLGQMAQKLKDQKAIRDLLNSGEAKRIVELLGDRDSVQAAAKAAAGGNSGQLMDMMRQMMGTKEGAQLVDRITEQARRSGIKQEK